MATTRRPVGARGLDITKSVLRGAEARHRWEEIVFVKYPSKVVWIVCVLVVLAGVAGVVVWQRTRY